MQTTWRWIVLTTFLSLFAVGASYAALRAAAQEPPAAEPATPPPAAEQGESTPNTPPAGDPSVGTAGDPDDPTNDGEGAVPAQLEELPPDMRFSADDNVSFPVDI
jgi:hypothetical protein